MAKVESLKCPECGSHEVSKDFNGMAGRTKIARNVLYCYGCKKRIDLSTGGASTFDEAGWFCNEQYKIRDQRRDEVEAARNSRVEGE